MLYFSGIAFNRGENQPGSIFVARFIDNNNKPNGDTIQYLSTAQVDLGNSGQFIDKPWLAVDAPLAGAPLCTIPTTPPQSFPAGNVYIAYAIFPGNNNNQIVFSKSTNCGSTWSHPTKVSASQQLNHGRHDGGLAGGARRSARRRLACRHRTPSTSRGGRFGFGTPNGTDAILIAKSVDGGNSFSPAKEIAVFQPFDQGGDAHLDADELLSIDDDRFERARLRRLVAAQRGR
jgi:hypothetical protein